MATTHNTQAFKVGTVINFNPDKELKVEHSVTGTLLDMLTYWHKAPIWLNNFKKQHSGFTDEQIAALISSNLNAEVVMTEGTSNKFKGFYIYRVKIDSICHESMFMIQCD